MPALDRLVAITEEGIKVSEIAMALGLFGSDEIENPAAFAIRKFGRVDELPNGAYATVMSHVTSGGGIQIVEFLDTAISMYLVGIVGETSTVKLYYLDDNLDRQNVTIVLTEDTPILAATDIRFPYRMKVISADDSAGIISLQNLAADTVYLEIPNGIDKDNQSQFAAYVVPTGYIGFITQVYASATKDKPVRVQYRYKPEGEANKVARPVELVSGVWTEVFSLGYTFNEGTLLEVRALASNPLTQISCGWDMVVIRKDAFNAFARNYLNEPNFDIEVNMGWS